MLEVSVLRVFTDAEGRFGNPLGVVVDGESLNQEQRQAIATALGYAETIFFEDIPQARLRIHTPGREIPLAGHPLVGAAWFLRELTGKAPETLRPVLAAEVKTWIEDDLTWIRGRVDDAPPWEFVELATPADVDALPFPAAPEHDMHAFYAWIDRDAGVLRARVFGSRYAVPEDEATGSAALRFAPIPGRPFTVHQGEGSVVYGRPAADRYADVGGRVVSESTRRI